MAEYITIKREVVQQALDALEWSRPHHNAAITHDEAITALRTALAAPAAPSQYGSDELQALILAKMTAQEQK